MCGRTAQGLPPEQIRQELGRTLPRRPEESWIDEDRYRTSQVFNLGVILVAIDVTTITDASVFIYFSTLLWLVGTKIKRYNVAPTRYQPVVRAEGNSNQYVVHMMRWGLIPHYTKTMPDYNSVLKSINARDDSLFVGPTSKSMFTHSKNYKRCIVLAEGFYEWRRRGKDRVPFYTKRKDGCLMLMAAIYDVAQIQGESQPLYTYATITTNASKQLEWLHDRMPVLIPNHEPEKIKAWLDPKVQWNSALESMLKPCDEYLEVVEDSNPEVKESDGDLKKPVYALETYQVDEKVNNVRNDSPDFAKPWNSSSNKKTLNRFFMPGTAVPPDDIKAKDIGIQNRTSEQTASATEKLISSESAVTTTSPTIDNQSSKISRRTIKMESDDEGDEEDAATGVGAGDYKTILEQLRPSVGGVKQGSLSDSFDNDPSEAGFTDMQQQQQDNGSVVDEEEDDDLKLALEASRREHEMNTSFSRSQSPPLFLISGSEESVLSTPKTTEASPVAAAATSGNFTPKHTALSSPASSSPSGRSPLKVDSRGTVDLLEKRKRDLQQEEQEMKHVLELSRLQAIADGLDDTSLLQGATTILRQQSQGESMEEQQRRKEQEEIDQAIAASLQGNEEDTSSPLKARDMPEPSSLLSQQSTSSNSSLTSALSTSAHPASPTSKKSKSGPVVGTASPKKRGNPGPASSPASKKGKPNQASITSFFQQK